MNIEETKKAIEVMQSFVDGKEVQFKDGDGEWFDVDDPLWEWRNTEYRVKPKPKCRPYTFTEMCWAVKKHGGYIIRKDKTSPSVQHIEAFGGDYFHTYYCNNATNGTYEYLLEKFEWLDDGSPCGVLEE